MSTKLNVSRRKGMELFHITPIILGGDPENSNNMIWLTRKQHIEAVRYWNEVIAKLRDKNT